MGYETKTIADIMKMINDSIFLPDLQRGYVWKKEQIYKLYDSIMRGYPYGSILLWEIGEDLSDNLFFKNKYNLLSKYDDSVEAVKVPSDKNPDSFCFLIDGQQRLTSLYLSLNSRAEYKIGNHKNSLYINITSCVDNDDYLDVDSIKYEFKFKNRTEDYFVEELEDEKRCCWVKVSKIFNLPPMTDMVSINFKNSLITFLVSENLTKKDRQSYWRPIEELHYNLKNSKNVSFYKDNNTNIDNILEIFTRINSGGYALSFSDILFSFIKKVWVNASEAIQELTYQNQEENLIRIDCDFILRSLIFITAESDASANNHVQTNEMKFRIANFTEKKLAIFKDEKNWEIFKNSVLLVFGLIKLYPVLKHIKAQTAFIPLIDYVYCNKLDKISDADAKAMKAWLVKSQVAGLYSKQTEGYLTQIKNVLKNQQYIYFPTLKLVDAFKDDRHCSSFELSLDHLEKQKYHSSESNLILSLLLEKNNRLHGDITEQDHIFPKSTLKALHVEDTKINSIFNIRATDKPANRRKTNKSYEEWVDSLKQDKEDVFFRSFIPINPKTSDQMWDIKDFEIFLEERKKLITPVFLQISSDIEADCKNNINKKERKSK